MKKLLKNTAAALITAGIVVSLASCDEDLGNMKGDWTISTINGVSIEEYAAGAGVYVFSQHGNYKVSNKTLEVSGLSLDGTVFSIQYDVKKTDKGFDALKDGQTSINILYDEKNGTLSFEKDEKKYVLIKGKDDIESIFKKELETAVIPPDIDDDGNKIEQKEVIEEGEITDDSNSQSNNPYEDVGEILDDED